MTGPRAGRLRGRGRSLGVGVLAALTAFLVVLTLVAHWTSTTALNTQQFVDRVTPIIEQEQVRTAVATEISSQLVGILDAEARVRPLLPSNLALLSVPIGAGVENLVTKRVGILVNSPAFRTLWQQALTQSHGRIVQALTGSSANLQIVQGKVVIDLIGVVRAVLRDLSTTIPFLVGADLLSRLPDNLPLDQVRGVLSNYFGVQLPPAFAQIPVMDSSALETARGAIRIVNLSVLLVALLALLAFGLMLWLSRTRRRTLLQFGLWTAGLTLLVSFVAREVTRAGIAGISDDVIRPAVGAGLTVVFGSLRDAGALLTWSGILVALGAYLLGPGDGPRWLREQAKRGWIRDHVDVLRVAGIAVAAAVVLIWGGWSTLILVALGLGAFEVWLSTLSVAAKPDTETL